MTKWIIVPVLFISFFSLATAQDLEEKTLGLTLDLTYTSKWLSKGVEAYGADGGFFETLDLDFYGTGLGVKVTHRSATGSGRVDSQRFDYRPYYMGSLFDGESYATNFNFSVGYEHYYGLSRHKANTTLEWVLACSWPQLLSGGLVPKYIVHYEDPVGSVPSRYDLYGYVHRFILDYNMDIESMPNPVTLSSEIALYDGLGGKARDWAYATWGLSSKFNINKTVSFVPGVYYQRTLDKSISPNQDIVYGMFSMKYAF